MFEVMFNGASIWSLENITPTKFEKVKVMAGNEWSASTVDGQIRGLAIVSKAE